MRRRQTRLPAADNDAIPHRNNPIRRFKNLLSQAIGSVNSFSLSGFFAAADRAFLSPVGALRVVTRSQTGWTEIVPRHTAVWVLMNHQPAPVCTVTVNDTVPTPVQVRLIGMSGRGRSTASSLTL